MLLHRLFGGEDHPGAAVGDLRAVAGRDLAPGPLESRLELGELLDRAVLELAGEEPFLLRAGEPLLALDRVTIGIGARYTEEMGKYLGGLTHIELDQRIRQSALQADDGLEERGTKAEHRYQSRPDVARAEYARVPVDRAAPEQKRRLAERFRTTRENEIAMAGANILVCDVDRLHAGAAIDLHREGGHVLAHAEAQRRHARWIHLLGGHADAAENDLVESIRGEWLAQQQRPPAGHREIHRRERARTPTRPDEGRAAAIHNKDRPCCYSAAVG